MVPPELRADPSSAAIILNAPTFHCATEAVNTRLLISIYLSDRVSPTDASASHVACASVV